MKMLNVSPSTIKYVRYKEVSTKIKEQALQVLNKAPFSRSTSTIPLSISSSPGKYYFNYIFERFIEKGKSRTSPIAPWSVKDGFVHWVNSKGDSMPFQMASTMKIVDGAGNPIAVVNHSYRNMAKIIAGAPTLYKTLLYLYLYKDDLINDENGGVEFKDYLEKLISIYGLGYTFNPKNSDTDSILSIVSEEWLDRFIKEVLNGRNDEELEEYLNGDERAFESKIWNCLRDAVRGTFSSVKTDLDIGDLSMQIVKETMNYDTITVDSLREVIRNVLGVREEYNENDGTVSGEYYTAFRGMELNDNNLFLWNRGESDKFDSYVSRDVHITDVNVKHLLKTLSVRKDLLDTLPAVIEQDIKDAILGGKYNKMNHADMLHVMATIYTKRKYYLKVYNYDVVKIGDALHESCKDLDLPMDE